MKTRPFHTLATLALIAIVPLAVVACGSKESSAPAHVAPETAAPAVAVVEEPKAADNSVAKEAGSADNSASDSQVSTADTVDSDSQANVKSTPVADPSEAAVLEDADSEEMEEAAALLTAYTGYGFSLKLDLGADVWAAGWTEPEPSVTQGIIAFSYGGVNANLVWGPPQDRTALTFLADTYNILRASQPSVTFESISDGDISISGQEGVYGGFKAVDNSGAAIGGGLIGAWICGDSDTAFRMTLTGGDATVVQLRFDRLLENFACSSS